MKWIEFKQGVESCQDELLPKKFGIWDNFPILCGGRHSLEEVTSFLFASGKYQQHKFENDINYDSYSKNHLPEFLEKIRAVHERWLAYSLGTVLVNPMQKLSSAWTIIDADFERHDNFQKRKYAFELMIHPFQKRKIEGKSDLRAVADVILDITGNILIPHEIPFCLPRVFNYKPEAEKQDYSIIVYWPDSLEEQARNGGVFERK